jgi:hypothetical protein
LSDGKFRDSFPCPTIILIIFTSFFRIFAKFRFFNSHVSRARVRANLIRYALSPLLSDFRCRVIYPVILTHYLLFLSQCDSLNTKSDLFVSFLQSFTENEKPPRCDGFKDYRLIFRFQPRYDAATDCPSLRKFSSGSKILNFSSAPWFLSTSFALFIIISPPSPLITRPISNTFSNL